MNLVLGKEHLGKIVRLDVLTVVTLPEKVFKEGDLIVLFNNTDSRTTLESKLAQTCQHSSMDALAVSVQRSTPKKLSGPP